MSVSSASRFDLVLRRRLRDGSTSAAIDFATAFLVPLSECCCCEAFVGSCATVIVGSPVVVIERRYRLRLMRMVCGACCFPVMISLWWCLCACNNNSRLLYSSLSFKYCSVGLGGVRFFSVFCSCRQSGNFEGCVGVSCEMSEYS